MALTCLFLSHTAPGGVFRVGSHHLSDGLRARGHAVLHASTPVSVGHLGRLREPEVRRRWRIAASRPDGTRVPVALLPSLLTRADARLVARQLPGRFDVALVDQPAYASVLPLLDVGRVVYRPTDVHQLGPQARVERRALALADGVVATSPVVLEGLDVGARPTLVLENGVDAARFAAPPGLGPRRGLVYVGALDERFDWDVLAAVARGLPDERVTVIGPLPRRVPALPGNVALVGPVDPADLPARLWQARVGLLPLSDHPDNAGRSPMKSYEYLAAGLSVLATATPTLVRRGPVPATCLYADAAQAVDLARELVRAPVDPAGVEAARAVDWSVKTALLEEFLLGL